MRLRQPTDFLILECLEDQGRNVAPNIAHHIEKSRKNVNTRLPVLADYGLARKIGPADRSGLYEITDRGKAALVYRDEYNTADDFEALIESPSPSDGDGMTSQEAFVRGSNSDSEDV